MPVSSIQIVSADRGSSQVEARFVFTFDSGDVVRDGVRFYPTGTDLNAAAAILAAGIEAHLKDRELHDCVFRFTWNYALKHSTNTELAAFVRALYKESNKETLARIAKRILEWISNGRFTETQVRNVFELTVTQWNTLKAKMQVLVDSFNVIEAAEGE